VQWEAVAIAASVLARHYPDHPLTAGGGIGVTLERGAVVASSRSSGAALSRRHLQLRHAARGGAEAHDRHCRSGSDKRIEEMREEEEVVSLEELARVARLALHAAAEHKEQGNRHSLISHSPHVSSYYYICVPMLLYTFPHMCPHTTICVLILLYM
jgi:hypothetical protein